MKFKTTINDIEVKHMGKVSGSLYLYMCNNDRLYFVNHKRDKIELALDVSAAGDCYLTFLDGTIEKTVLDVTV